MNVVVMIGRLTRDPELKYSKGGDAYANFSIAVDNPFKKDEADFINCVCFKKTAEILGEYFRKGNKIGITGRMQMEKYESNGEKRVTYKVLVEKLEILDSKKQDEHTQHEKKESAKVEETAEDEFPF